jgi:hypothetical protein
LVALLEMSLQGCVRRAVACLCDGHVTVDHLVVGNLGNVDALVAFPSVSRSWASEEVGSTREMQVPVKRMWLWMALTVALWT